MCIVLPLLHIVMYSPLDFLAIGLKINIKANNKGETFVHTFLSENHRVNFEF